MPLDVPDLKKQLRRDIEAKRSSLSMDERSLKSKAICDAAVESVLLPQFRHWLQRREESDLPPALFTYIPFRAEVDVTPILRWCWGHGIQVVAPRVVPDGRQMTLHFLHSLEQLEAGAYGIREPKPDIPEWTDLSRLELMLVPGLAFDAEMGRLGYGGGYYDRFMHKCLEQSSREPFKLALAYDVQVVPRVPMDDHDFRVDAIVTETRVLHKKL